MAFPLGAAIGAVGRAMASTYGRALASRATPYVSQYLRGFGRSLIPGYGTVSNLAYASRLQRKLAAARISGAVSADIATIGGGMASAYLVSTMKKSSSPSSSRGSGRSRRRRRYLEE
jgi:hypothetical protein